MELIFPTIEWKQAALEYRQEFFDAGVKDIDGDGGLDYAETYEGWLAQLQDNLTRVDDKRVPSTTYFGVVNSRIVGTVDIRHKLNDYLQKFGGHIGYGVRPSERRKGYATKMLSHALEECRKLGLEKVLLTCDKGNEASAKTITKNGGILENELVQDDGRITQRYWILLKHMFENDTVIGTLSTDVHGNPFDKTLIGSFVVVPKSYVSSPFELCEQEWADTKKMIDIIKEYIDDKYEPDGYTIGWNVGPVAGQTVPYAHLHIIPRHKDEPFAGKGIRYWIKKSENTRPEKS